MQRIRSPGIDISAKPLEIKLCQKFTRAYQAFKENNLVLAKELFQEIQQKFPDDHPTQIFLQKI